MSSDIKKILWDVCNKVRDESSLKIEQAQPYFLGFMFFKFLSEKIEKEVDILLAQEKLKYQNLDEDKELYDLVEKKCVERIGYFLNYKDTFKSVINDCNSGNGELTDRLQKAFKSIEDSTIGSSSAKDFNGLFSDISLDSSSLGSNNEEKTETLMHLIKSLDRDDLKMNDMDKDSLGDTYEYIIGMFASESGQKAGEFYTPAPVSRLLAKIAMNNMKSASYIYDPTCGSASLLVKAKDQISDFGKLLGQEKANQTFNMARMNMFLHGLRHDQFSIENGNTLVDNKFNDYAGKIDVVVANPPFSVSWKPEELEKDPRFKNYPKMAPKSKADFAFIQHMIYMLKEKGRCAVVVPHGVLFRGAAEGAIRKYLIENDKYLRAVIGLPTNMFFNASIPACILYFEKETKNEKIIFIEASKEFTKQKNKNTMEKKHVDKIFDTFINKKEVDKFSRLVSLEEIKENDYNLNITRYVDTFEEEEPIDIDEVNRELKKINEEIAKTEKEIEAMIAQIKESK